MKKINIQDAVGMELGHDITEMNATFKGVAFKRGHIIRECDVEHMLRIGKQHVFVWEAQAGEIHEDDCAGRMAAMAPVEGAHYTEPAEGKVLLMADQRGTDSGGGAALRPGEAFAAAPLSAPEGGCGDYRQRDLPRADYGHVRPCHRSQAAAVSQ